MTRRDSIRNEHIRDNKCGASFQENNIKTTVVVRPCEEEERGAHSEKHATTGHNGGIRSSVIPATPDGGTT